MTVAIEEIHGGTNFNVGSNVGISSSQGGTITTDGTDRLVVLAFFTGRSDNSLNQVHVNSVTASGLTFTRVFTDHYTYTDGSYGSFTHGTISIDIFTAPAAAQQTNVAWTTTTDGDGFTNNGGCTGFAVSGLFDINSPFDPSNAFDVSSDTSGSSTTPTVTGVDTANSSDLIVGFFTEHSVNPASADITAGSGWTNIGSVAANGSFSSSQFATRAEYKNFSSPQSSLSVPLGSSNAYWYGVAISFTAVGGNTWASTEATDVMAFSGYPGVPWPHGDLASTEATDTFAGAGYPAMYAAMAASEFPDAFSAYGFQPLVGTLSATERKDTFAGAGIGYGSDGTWASTEAIDIFTATGYAPVSGTFNTSESPDRFNALGAGVTRVRRRRTVIVA